MASSPRSCSTLLRLNLNPNAARRWNQPWLEWESEAGIKETYAEEATVSSTFA